MTLPSIVPVGYSETTNDFLKTKVDHSGAERASYGVVSVLTGTVTTTIVGLIPFNKGARLASSYVYSDALGTSVTLDLGYVYSDNVSNTNKSNAFLAASTTAAAGGSLVVNTPDVATWTATGDGWIVAVVGGATTGSTGNLSFRIGNVYDVGGLPT